MNPPLKWAGGKRLLVPRLRALYEPHRHRKLVEPFVGGMAVALGLLPVQATLADKNFWLVNFYLRLRDPRPFTIRMENDEKLYYEHRAAFNVHIALTGEKHVYDSDAAELFYYLNRTGFNGLCRFNQKGHYNVPFGKYKSINYRRDFSEYVSLLQKWVIGYGDFESLCWDQTAWVYLDPPYDVEFTTYSAGGFSWDDQVRLAKRFATHPGPVVASNQATSRILDLYRGLGYVVETLSAPRRISCTGDRADALEILATKNLS